MSKKITMTAEDLALEAETTGDNPPSLEPGPPKPAPQRVQVETPPRQLQMTRADELLKKPEAVRIKSEAPSPSDIHRCGLPMHFMVPSSKPRIVAYVSQYEFGHEERERLEITTAERELYAIYRQAIGQLAVSMDFFVAALRMWRSGEFSLYRGPRLDLRKFKVETVEPNKQ